MPDESTGAGAPQPQQAAEGQQPEGGSPQSASPTPDTPTPETERQPSANKLIKDFAAERGISVEDLLGKYREIEDASKTELERLTGQVNDFRSKYEQTVTELQNTRSESAFLEAAREARARAPKTLFRAYRDQLEYDTAGQPTNIAEVIEAIRNDEPDLFQPANGTSDAGRRGDAGTAPTDINTLIRQMASEAR